MAPPRSVDTVKTAGSEEPRRSAAPLLRRRAFTGALAAAAIFGGCGGAAWPSRILVLGGTSFVGPPIVDALVGRGHAVTLFNRGRTNPGLFADLEQLRGDRAGDLSALRGRTWDAVVDISGVVPSWVDASAGLLAPVVGRYVLISSTSVYSSFERGPADESLPLKPDPPRRDDHDAPYGQRKAGCERAALAAMSGRACALRSTYVVGPGDSRGLLQAWLARVAEGGPLAAPGGPDHRIVFLDRRDLARFTTLAVEYRAVGPYNVTQRASVAEVLASAASITGSVIRPGYIDDHALAVAGATKAFPLHIRRRAGIRLFPELVVERALRAGMRPRPLAATLAEIWAELRGEVGADARARARRRWPTRTRELELLELARASAAST